MDEADLRQEQTQPALLQLEGFHAVKHALRFGADVRAAFCSDPSELEELVALLAPDLRERLGSLCQEVSRKQLDEMVGRRVHTSVVAFAVAPNWSMSDLESDPSRPVIVLDDPRDSGNVGACIRVAAAVNAGGVIVLSGRSPLELGAIRGAAGLQYALPCVYLEEAAEIPSIDRTWVGFDADGSTFIPDRRVTAPAFVFGSERMGLRPKIRDSCDHIRALPMAPNVSSLNLATAVAAVTYLWRYHHGDWHRHV